MPFVIGVIFSKGKGLGKLESKGIIEIIQTKALLSQQEYVKKF